MTKKKSKTKKSKPKSTTLGVKNNDWLGGLLLSNTLYLLTFIIVYVIGVTENPDWTGYYILVNSIFALLSVLLVCVIIIEFREEDEYMMLRFLIEKKILKEFDLWVNIKLIVGSALAPMFIFPGLEFIFNQNNLNMMLMGLICIIIAEGLFLFVDEKK